MLNGIEFALRDLAKIHVGHVVTVVTNFQLAFQLAERRWLGRSLRVVSESSSHVTKRHAAVVFGRLGNEVSVILVTC